MPTWLKISNIAWFRLLIADEPNEAKRQDLELRLAQAEAEVEADLANFNAPVKAA
ncbi:MAG TPA: hypothetical protein VGG27_02920 [Magnetospirillaceae bacterium]|jgi:hypothetical protein